MDHFAVVLAGGEGIRFWPLSRKKTPKQLLNLSGKNILINETIERLACVIDKEKIFVVTNDMQADTVVAATEDCNIRRDNIIIEPVAKSTTACIGLSAYNIARLFGDGIVVVSPSDHYISNEHLFQDAIKEAIWAAENEDKLIVIAVPPTAPLSDFGYIQIEETPESIIPAVSFIEKPDPITANEYLNNGHYVWNSGVLVGKASLFMRMIEKYAEDIHTALKAIEDSISTHQNQERINQTYNQIRSISIDYAILEPCAQNGELLVKVVDCGWNDVGCWNRLDAIYKPDSDGNIVIGDVQTIDTSGCIVYSQNRTIATIGIEDLIVVEMPDVVLVCNRNRSNMIQTMVEQLKSNKRNELL